MRVGQDGGTAGITTRSSSPTVIDDLDISQVTIGRVSVRQREEPVEEGPEPPHHALKGRQSNLNQEGG
jgi:hypothetical protein